MTDTTMRRVLHIPDSAWTFDSASLLSYLLSQFCKSIQLKTLQVIFSGIARIANSCENLLPISF